MPAHIVLAVVEVAEEALLAQVESSAPTACPARTSAVMRCMAVVDLPEPPFSLPITISRAMRDLGNQMARPFGARH